METGLIHIYCGDGKGKTTAAVGLAVRAAAHGLHVHFVQFMKPGDAVELDSLESLGVHVTRVVQDKFSFQMTEAERSAARAKNDEALEMVLSHISAGATRETGDECAAPCDLLVFDEAIGACDAGLLSEDMLRDLMETKPEGLELVLTGRNPKPFMLELADYVTEMTCRKHPFEQGIAAREGVEY